MLEPPPCAPSSPRAPSRSSGSRRIFPAIFKLQVLDAYRLDHECKGNQRATARKFNIHRRQIQKWLQCEAALRASVSENYSEEKKNIVTSDPSSRLRSRLVEPISRVFKHDAKSLKLVAHKLYPSATGDVNSTLLQSYDSIKDYTLQKTVPSPPNKLEVVTNRNCTGVSGGVCYYDIKTKTFCPSCPSYQPYSPTQSYTSGSLSPCSTYSASVSPSSESTNSEPINMRISSQPESPRLTDLAPFGKNSAFHPKRKWLQDSLQESKNSEEMAIQDSPVNARVVEPETKKKRLDFSIERLCGSPDVKDFSIERLCGSPDAKAEMDSTNKVSSDCHVAQASRVNFPPPLLLPHRTIPQLMSLHFRPDCSPSKEEPSSSDNDEDDDEDEDIDILSTSPLDDKTFEFPSGIPGGKRRSFSLQFKLNVVNAFYTDKECNQNQRATARKFNINRRQVQKWLSLEEELRSAVPNASCVGCPQHCAYNQQLPCVLGYCALSSCPPIAPYGWFSIY